MVKGKLLPKEKLKRHPRQELAFKDPISKKKVEIRLSVVGEGENRGCPVIEVKGRLVLFELKELAYQAVLLFREEGILPKGTAKEQEAERERLASGVTTGFSSAASKEDE